MKNYLEENLNVLARKAPELAERIRSLQSEEWTIEELPGGEIDLRHQTKLLYGGKPQQHYRRFLSQSDFQYPKWVIFYGVGLGGVISEFFKGNLKEVEHILVVEKSPLFFRRSLEIMDWRAILEDSRVELMVGLIGIEMEDFITSYVGQQDRLILVRALTPVCDSAAMSEDEKYYLQVAQMIQRAVEFVHAFLISPPEDAYQGFMNIIHNLKESAKVPAFENLEGLFEGFPGIVVSTGPSLEKAIPWLKKVQDRAVIACADSALRILLKHGITPHFSGCLERVSQTCFLFENLPPVPETWLITDPMIWPNTYKSYPGPKLNMLRHLGQTKWFYPDRKFYACGSSVAHKLTVALKQMGCSSILLVGQDLAFDRYSEKTHAEGIPKIIYDYAQKERKFFEKGASQGGTHCVVEGNNGQPILTSPTLNSFRKFFGQLIREEKMNCYNVIPKEYGAKIPHAIWKDPEEVFSLLGESRPVVKLIQERLARFPVEDFRKYKKRIQRLLDKSEEYLKVYQQVSLDILDSISLFCHQYDVSLCDEEVFRPMLERLEKVTVDFERHLFGEEDFYGDFFLALIQDRSFAVSQLSHALLKQKMPPHERIAAQISLFRDVYNTSQLWSARMGKFLRDCALQNRIWKEDTEKPALQKREETQPPCLH